MPSDRHVEMTSPLGKDVLLFQRLTASDTLGRPFALELEVLSKDHEIALDSVIGKAFSLRLETRAGNERRFHAIATEFGHAGSHLHYARYKVMLRPWLWLLTRTASCRIFQEKSVPDIIKEVFRDHGFSDFKDSLAGSYEKRSYCVQYRESDFDFVSRLIEHEGIYYFFEHSASKHTLVLADGYGAHSKASGYATIHYYPPDPHGRRKEEHLNEVTGTKRIQPGKYKLDSFDFEKPRADLAASSVASRSHDHAQYEIYDYPADYSRSSQGDGYARVRLEGHQARHETIAASGDACGVVAGNLFSLEGHPRQALNREYLIVSSCHKLEMQGYESGTGSLTLSDSLSLEAIESQQPFRSAETTPKPVIPGPQTAIVVGKKGEEIWTDEHGRVKVQFHWDREGEEDENSSCWIRVAQIWAGGAWGAIALPRIGQEVIVEFLNGDPDQPIVTGRVYNGDNKVPYPLPARQTQMGIRSRSTKKGNADNFNELRFEDEKGNEYVFFHAERDLHQRVKEDDFEHVGGERHLTVKKNDYSVYEMSRHSEVKSDVVEKVGGSHHAQVGMERHAKVGMLEAVESGMDIHLKGGMNVVIEAGLQLTLKGSGGFISIDPSGVTIQGTLVKINSGGAPGAGKGAKPEAPKPAKEPRKE